MNYHTKTSPTEQRNAHLFTMGITFFFNINAEAKKEEWAGQLAKPL